MALINDAFKEVRKLMQPPQWASWQTLIFLSIFSALVAALTTSPQPQIAQRIISSFGWLFLVLGVWWFIYEPTVKKKLTFFNLFLGPWLVGALVCVWFFGTIEGRTVPTQAAFISWPPISSIIWACPKFVKSDPKTKSPIYTNPKKDHRQDIILVLLSNLVLSCWFQFYFQINTWMAQYPSLRADDLSRSAFVWRPAQFDKAAALSRGADMLNIAAQEVRSQLEGKPWSEVERWLEQLDQNRPALQQQVRSQLPRVAEADLWNLETQVTSAAYDLQLRAIWTGPTSRSGGYELSRTCRISQSRRQGPPTQFNFNNNAPAATAPTTPRLVGTVQCGTITQPQQIKQARS
ncbi:MAG: DUF5357 domain-containing protein [Leptolyngbya sp. Prado105]|jgi:hypothetical protein|nr:DUF5357 domain-containing protein [Leptolyngbya sp. Prado105]